MSRVYLVLLITACGRIGFDPLLQSSGEPLALTAPATRTNLNTSVAFEATGGRPPYDYAIASGTGELDATSGVFWSPSYPGDAMIEVIDAAGATSSASITFGGDFIYEVGGFFNGLGRDEVYRSADGAQWGLVGRFPIARTFGVQLVFQDQLFYIGGSPQPDGSNPSDEVWTSNDGASWTLVGHLPAPREVAGGAVFHGRIWIGGGISLGGVAWTTEVWSSADGVAWQPEPALPVAIHGSIFLPWQDQLWSIAGHVVAGQTDTIHVLSGQSWVVRGAVPVPGEYHAATVYRGALWVSGGLGLMDRVVTTTDATSWTDAALTPTNRTDAGIVELSGELWIMGGLPAQPLHSIDGAAWTPAGSFPLELEGGRYTLFTPR